jgi:hypothetical protein
MAIVLFNTPIKKATLENQFRLFGFLRKIRGSNKIPS